MADVTLPRNRILSYLLRHGLLLAIILAAP
jgi:hypothetical protein